jgi:hypothetical protein
MVEINKGLVGRVSISNRPRVCFGAVLQFPYENRKDDSFFGSNDHCTASNGQNTKLAYGACVVGLRKWAHPHLVIAIPDIVHPFRKERSAADGHPRQSCW